MGLYIPCMDDRKIAILFWRDKEFKKFAVDVTAGTRKRRAYANTFYARARTQEGAIECVKDQAIGLPKRGQFTARLAGPRELGCELIK